MNKYREKYFKYKKKYQNLVEQNGFGSPLSSLDDMYTRFDQNIYLNNWCYDNDIKIIDADITDTLTLGSGFGKNFDNLEIPNNITVTTEFTLDGEKFSRTNNYKFRSTLGHGTYGIVLGYNKLDQSPGLSKIALKIISRRSSRLTTDDIISGYILPELDVINGTKDSICRKISSYNLDLGKISSYKKINFYDPIYEQYKIYYSERFKSPLTMSIMPAGDGNIYDGLFQNELFDIKEKRKMFLYILEVFKCMLEKHDLVYADLKLEQIIYFTCTKPDGSTVFMYTLADLGGFQKSDTHPLSSFGPRQDLVRHYKISSLNIALYQLAALWHDIYSTKSQLRILKLSQKYNKMFTISWEELEDLVNKNLGNPRGLEHQREIIKYILYNDPLIFQVKEKILEFIDNLIRHN